MTNTLATTPANELTIVEAAAHLRAKTLTVEALWDACAAAATAKNSTLNALLELFPKNTDEIAAAQARIDAERDAAPLLCGIPLAIKDNILIEGHIASAASRMLETYEATYDATVIAKLKEQNALFIGRANMDEFAMGSSTEHSAFGPTLNPLDISRVPGGSSGGSAAAVAAHMALGALGTDTGGSIRQPAAHCGLVGLKPTYGAVSRYGAIALGSSLDQIGPLAKSVEDARIIHNAIAGHDPMDATTNTPGLFTSAPEKQHFTIGVPRHLLSEGVDADVLATFEKTLTALADQGHTIVDVSLPTSSYALAAYYVVMPAEASTNLARYDGIRYGHAADTHGEASLVADYIRNRTEGFGDETIKRILLGTFVLSSGYIDAYYRTAERARDVLRAEYNNAFKNCDVIAFPTTPSPAFKFGEKSDDPLAMYLEDVFTVTANLTGMPALSVPMSRVGMVARDGVSLPVGLHLTASHGHESTLFALASAAYH